MGNAGFVWRKNTASTMNACNAGHKNDEDLSRSRLGMA